LQQLRFNVKVSKSQEYSSVQFTRLQLQVKRLLDHTCINVQTNRNFQKTGNKQKIYFKKTNNIEKFRTLTRNCFVFSSSV